MHDSEIKCRIVRRLWRDRIYASSSYADVDTVADYAVDSTDEGRAKELCEQMARDSDSPVVWGIAGQAIAVRKDEEAVARFLKEHGGKDALLWDLQGVLSQSEDGSAEVSDILR